MNSLQTSRAPLALPAPLPGSILPVASRGLGHGGQRRWLGWLGLGVSLWACASIDVGTLGPGAGLAVDAIEDGGDAGTGGRAVSLGQTVRVTVRATNRARFPVRGLAARLTFRRADGELEPVDAVVSAVGAPPSGLRPQESGAFAFDVVLPEVARGSAWVVGAELSSASVPTTSAAAAQERTWQVQRPARLEVTGVTVLLGNDTLGGLGLNPGCPALLAVGLRNGGEAAVDVRAVELSLDGRAPGELLATLLDVQPGRALAAGAASVARVRVETTETLGGPVRAQGRVAVRGVDVNSDLAVTGEPGRGATLDLTLSPSRLSLSALSGPASARVGAQGLALAAIARFEPARPGVGPLDGLRARLPLGPEAAWAAVVTSPSSVVPCPAPPAACPGITLALSADVPSDASEGTTRLGLLLAGREPEALGGGSGLGVCGLLLPSAGAALELLP